jgi:uncharacterized radical SAM superfamily protein
MRNPPAALVQLPFPSQEDPLPELDTYYNHYEVRFQDAFPDYAIEPGELWEMPLWIAHLDGAIGREDTEFINLSRTPCTISSCVAALSLQCTAGATLFFSPLAQNFDLACAVSRAMISRGHRTAIGGNMAMLASTDSFTWIAPDKFRTGTYPALLASDPGIYTTQPKRRGPRQPALGYRPQYRLLQEFAGRVPLLRINASHGCLFACTFCGDAWTRELHVVPVDDLKSELEELRELFPETRLVYIGDKTFGQSPRAVAALLETFAEHQDLSLIVQTHVMMVKPSILEALNELPVVAAELGFETGNESVLASVHKGRRTADDVLSALRELKSIGVKPVLNVLGGLPDEKSATHEVTREFLEEARSLVWLFNIYNFVPYPLTPLFPTLRPRIHDWDFANWREDRPVVFEPYHQSAGESWDQFLDLIQVCTEIVAS